MRGKQNNLSSRHFAQAISEQNSDKDKKKVCDPIYVNRKEKVTFPSSWIRQKPSSEIFIVGLVHFERKKNTSQSVVSGIIKDTKKRMCAALTLAGWVCLWAALFSVVFSRISVAPLTLKPLLFSSGLSPVSSCSRDQSRITSCTNGLRRSTSRKAVMLAPPYLNSSKSSRSKSWKGNYSKKCNGRKEKQVFKFSKLEPLHIGLVHAVSAWSKRSLHWTAMPTCDFTNAK